MTERAYLDLPGFALESSAAVPVGTVRRRLEVALANFNVADAAIHAAIMAVGGMLQEQRRFDDEGEGVCLHLDAVSIETFQDGSPRVLCPNCGEVDAA